MAITPFKVTDFGTNRKPIYDFLLVINSNLPSILHRFQVTANYMWNFRLGRYTLTPSLGWPPPNIAISDIRLKLDSLGYISLNVSVYLKPQKMYLPKNT